MDCGVFTTIIIEGYMYYVCTCVQSLSQVIHVCKVFITKWTCSDVIITVLWYAFYLCIHIPVGVWGTIGLEIVVVENFHGFVI